MVKFMIEHTKKHSKIYADLRIDINLGRLDKKLEKAQEMLINQIRIDSEKYVPAQNLILSNSAHPENNNKELVYSGSYARYQYFGHVMTDERGRTFVGKGEKKPIVTNRKLVYSKEQHPLADSEWFEKARKRYQSEWIKKVKDVVKDG
jgi:hypothetical protein